MFDRSQDPNVQNAARRLLAALAGVDDRPKSATAYLASQDLGDALAHSCAVDGAACERCAGSDGVILTVPNAVIDGKPHPNSHRISLILFEHDAIPRGIHMGTEQAKQLVNRLGEAIAVAERIDAEGATK